MAIHEGALPTDNDVPSEERAGRWASMTQSVALPRRRAVGIGSAPKKPTATRLIPPTKSAVTVSNYRNDPLYPRIVRATDAILKGGKVVRPVDVLVCMGLLTPAQLENWRAGRVPYLEQVIAGNLTRLSRLLRILRFHLHDLNLVPSISAYTRGERSSSPLSFTKSGDTTLEKIYATHFVWPGKKPFHARAEKDFAWRRVRVE